MRLEPMRLLRIPHAFDHPDFLFELKLDGFRALAVVERGRCRLVSRNGYEFSTWPQLGADIAAAVGRRSVVLDGEIVCLEDDGRPNFNALLFRRGSPWFYAFDVLRAGRRDVRAYPLRQRKRILRDLVPRGRSRLRYLDAVEGQGVALYREACARDLEGIVGKWAPGSYQSGPGTSWLKIKNPAYSQLEGRAELFDSRGATRREKQARPTLCLA